MITDTAIDMHTGEEFELRWTPEFDISLFEQQMHPLSIEDKEQALKVLNQLILAEKLFTNETNLSK